MFPRLAFFELPFTSYLGHEGLRILLDLLVQTPSLQTGKVWVADRKGLVPYHRASWLLSSLLLSENNFREAELQ